MVTPLLGIVEITLSLMIEDRVSWCKTQTSGHNHDKCHGFIGYIRKKGGRDNIKEYKMPENPITYWDFQAR